MRASVFYGPGRVNVDEIEEPVLEEGDIKIKVELCGVCGSDIKTFVRGTPYTKPPAVLGHEVVGTVIESRSYKWKKGDRVAVAHYIPCGVCPRCLEGKGTICPEIFERKIEPGGFVEKMRIPRDLAERATFKLDDDTSWKQAVLSEPLACCIHAAKQLSISPNSKVLIIGDGPMGLLHTQVVKAFGAKEVILSGMTSHRLERAKKLADYVINAQKKDIVSKVKEITNGEGPSHIIVAVPSIEAAQQALEMICLGGEILLFGGFSKNQELPVDPNGIHYDEVKLLGSVGSLPEDFYLALTLLSSRKIGSDLFITHRYSLDNVSKALELGTKQTGIKAVIDLSAASGTEEEL
ncbi:alcohol dehydrogenase catalytic domain-containing protein [Anaerosalibacter massiliensis]|uniref:Alcohol dehydrogenase catalytic domain-containing protein n=1 Tax=Anaerosalibacter massiliensis TaxID=1347392 RepID=A0A9X2MQJ0_9FIRM|nr:alcohol dehydrogenase catalytic domain-containing protein [Anaerosalibacter massiliensis]MCR2045351.1 alcohol dehydrogenase catalytic domain-containing protein [Anaerosalibacter massiliensis]